MNLFSVGMYLPLCFLLIQAYYASGDYHISRNDFKYPSVTKEKEHTKYTEAQLRDIGKKFYDEVDPYHKELEKRGLRAVLFGATLFLTLTNVGTDAFFGNGGCCLVHELKDKDACDKIPNIKSMSNQLAELGKKMDEEYLESQKTMTYLDNLNNQNFLFRNEIQRLRDLEESIVTTMDPKLVNEFKTKVAEIKELLNTGTEQTTTETYDITEMYKPLYKSWEGRAYLFGAFGLHVLGDLGEMAFDRAALNRVRRELQPELAHKLQMQAAGGTKARKVLGGTDSVKDLSTSMAKTKIEMDLSKSKSQRIMKGFTHLLGFLAIGFEIYELFHKVKKCTDSYKQVVIVEEKLTKALKNATGTYEQIQGNRTEITNQYKEMKKALVDDAFLDLVGDFRDFVLAAEPAARRRMRIAEINLQLFFKYIKVDSPSLTAKLQEWAIEGLRAIEIRYDCLLKRLKAMAAISSDCKAGTKNLTSIYQDISNEQELHKCVTKEGEPFTSFEQIEAFIQADSKNSTDENEWYNPKCRMNDVNLITLMCDNHCKDGYEYDYILKWRKVYSITTEELKTICEPKGYCDRELNPNEKATICGMKGDGFTIEQILKYNSFPTDKAKEAYAACA